MLEKLPGRYWVAHYIRYLRNSKVDLMKQRKQDKPLLV